jgi:uncharacterized repeat protein (TIGR03847 family)
MTSIDLDPVEKITTGAIGEPGRRTFYLQARKGQQLVTVIVEKQQVQLLAASILEILSRLDLETGEGPGEDQLELDEPVEPVWRAGRLSIGYQEERDLILLEIEEASPEDEEGEEEDEEAEEGASEAAGGSVPEPEPAMIAETELLEELERIVERERIRIWASREQMLALSRHGAAVAARGRPVCRYCGNPIDPEGHACPAMNGHGRP